MFPRTSRRVRLQLIGFLLLFALISTLLTGWLIYDRMSGQVLRDTWQQHEALLRGAAASVNREIGLIKSFSWQLSNDVRIKRYLHLADQTPQDILIKQGIIGDMQRMKAFSDTIADLGIRAEGPDIVITGESSYHTGDYYGRLTGITLKGLTELRNQPGTVALCRFAGAGTEHRILETVPVLAFVSSLPLTAQPGESYAFFHLSAERLSSCMPESGSGYLLLTDGEGNPMLPAVDPAIGNVSRAYMKKPESRVKSGKEEFGVLCAETEAEGLYCMAVVPYGELLRPSMRLRNMVMGIMGSCMLIGLIGAVLAGKRLYAPLERLIATVRQLSHRLPEGSPNNEYMLLDEAIRLITAENHELTLSNREINRLLKNRVLNDWMEGRLKSGAEEALRAAGVELPYAWVQIAVAEMAAMDLERLEKRQGGGSTAERIEALAGEAGDIGRKVFCAQRVDGHLLILFNLADPSSDPEAAERFIQVLRERIFDACPCGLGIGKPHEKERAAESLIEAMLDLRSGEDSSREEKQYARITDYLRREYMHEVSLDTAGEALGMSPSTISLLFRKIGETSFLKYLTDLRMEETRRLLVETDLPLREIGQRVGIENQNTLIRTFKKLEGVTPGQYRTAHSRRNDE
ncbi:MAG: helix-turn-helix transcriptional regulator [Clostridia bacterium]|nr:helix-turn-helix transcriptional regulator [Clostridia bacterium]